MAKNTKQTTDIDEQAFIKSMQVGLTAEHSTLSSVKKGEDALVSTPTMSDALLPHGQETAEAKTGTSAPAPRGKEVTDYRIKETGANVLRKRKSNISASEYESAFLERRDLGDRKMIYISKDLHMLFSRLMNLFPQHSLTLTGYVDSILRDHVNMYMEVMDEIYSREMSKCHNSLFTFGK